MVGPPRDRMAVTPATAQPTEKTSAWRRSCAREAKRERTSPKVRVRDPVVLRLDRLEERDGVVQPGIYTHKIKFSLVLAPTSRRKGRRLTGRVERFWGETHAGAVRPSCVLRMTEGRLEIGQDPRATRRNASQMEDRPRRASSFLSSQGTPRKVIQPAILICQS